MFTERRNEAIKRELAGREGMRRERRNETKKKEIAGREGMRREKRNEKTTKKNYMNKKKSEMVRKED